jgi:hypothetical protein
MKLLFLVTFSNSIINFLVVLIEQISNKVQHYYKNEKYH